jgi:hypothetical protein
MGEGNAEARLVRQPLYSRWALATGRRRPRRRGSALAFAALKWCGVIYLLYMAWQALRETGALSVDARLEQRSGRRAIVTGFLINILNPKLSIFSWRSCRSSLPQARAARCCGCWN